MLSKPLSLFLVYILIIVNFLLLALPFLAAIFPFMHIVGNQIVFAGFAAFNPKIAVYLLIFLVSFFMLFYLFLDFLFGFSVSAALKGCKRYDKLKGYEFLHDTFEQVRSKFSPHNVNLYIKNSDEINAFAVSSIRQRAVVLTSGLIDHYINSTENQQQFLVAIRSILGHEMSHLINKDFLPGLLIMINQRATNFVANILLFAFNLVSKLTRRSQVGMGITTGIIFTIYNISSWVLNCFNRLVINNIYEFLKNFFGRAAEYRCDRQSAKAFGGINMAFALSFLGKSGYLTLFSTHPATERRMRKVEVVEEKNAVIMASFWSQISNFAGMMILPVICLYTAHLSKADVMIKFYFYQHYPDIYFKVLQIISIFKQINF